MLTWAQSGETRLSWSLRWSGDSAPNGERRKSRESVHEGTSDEALVNEAWRLSTADNARILAAQMELTRRLMLALRAFNASSDEWSQRLATLTVALVVLTVVLIAIAVESTYLAWVLLDRAQ